MKAFFDAGVLFNAAHHGQAKSRHLILESGKLDFRPAICGYAVEEARRNLKLKYPKALPDMERLLVLFQMEETVLSGAVPAGIRAKDHPILLSAFACGADYLVTGDHRDFGTWLDQPIHPVGTLNIVSPALLFDLLVPKPR